MSSKTLSQSTSLGTSIPRTALPLHRPPFIQGARGCDSTHEGQREVRTCASLDTQEAKDGNVTSAPHLQPHRTLLPWDAEAGLPGMQVCSVPHPGEPHSPVPLLSASSLDLGRRAAELSPARRLASHTATEHTRPGWDLLFIYRFCKL